MKVFIGSDHAGYQLKQKILDIYKESEYEFIDCGPSDTTSVDYPDYARNVCTALLHEPQAKGVLICGSGIGMSIAANKINGIKAAHVQDSYNAKLARLHNDANVVCFGERIIGLDVAHDIIEQFLTTAFEGGRHINRINKIKSLES